MLRFSAKGRGLLRFAPLLFVTGVSALCLPFFAFVDLPVFGGARSQPDSSATNVAPSRTGSPLNSAAKSIIEPLSLHPKQCQVLALVLAVLVGMTKRFETRTKTYQVWISVLKFHRHLVRQRSHVISGLNRPVFAGGSNS